MRYLIVCLCTLLFIPAYAQHTCGFDQKTKHYLQQNPRLLSQLKQQDERLTALQKRRSVSGDRITIPIVIHVMHLGEPLGVGSNISDAQIYSAVDQLNKAFAGQDRYMGPNANIEFAMAANTPDCEYTNGITRTDASQICVEGDCYQTLGITNKNEASLKSLSGWPASDYLNIWVVAEIDGNNGQGGIQGFATFPETAPILDGVVMQHTAFGYDPESKRNFSVKNETRLGTIFIHEIGHVLGLYHTFEGDDYNRDGYGDRCPSKDGCGLFNGDCISDTPPHRRSNGSCATNLRNICDGGGLSAEHVNNFMDYSGEECQTTFTQGQIDRMRNVLETSRRSWKHSSTALIQNHGQAREPNCRPQTRRLSIAFSLGIAEVSIGDFTRLSGTAGEDGGYVDDWCTTVRLQSGTAYPVTIKTATTNKQNVSIYADLNDDGDFADHNELLLKSENATIHRGNIKIAQATKNKPLRLRVMSTYAGFKIKDACYAPMYGQVEDYTLIVDGATSPDIISFDQAPSPGSEQLVSNDFEVTAFPNPVFGDIVGLDFDSSLPLQSVRLNDQNGRQVRQYAPSDVQDSPQLSMSGLPMGVYYLRLVFASETKVLKISRL